MEQNNLRFQAKYKEIEENEVRYEEILCDDAEYMLVAFGCSARIGQKACEIAREQGIKLGLLRPITLWPFPDKAFKNINPKAYLSVEMNAGQMIEDVKLATECKVPTYFYGRTGGIIPTPEEIIQKIKEIAEEVGA